MGNGQSHNFPYSPYRKLSKELPPAKKMGWDDDYSYRDLGMEVFADEKDREQFIHAIIAVATANGLHDLGDHDFRLHYTRREDKEDQLVASIVAVKDGVIKAKIEPAMGGADQTEAFKALRKDVEVKLDRILQQVPDGRARGESLTAAGTSAVIAGPVDAPPAYSSPPVGVVHGKRG